MKKIIALTMLVGSMMFAGLAVEAKPPVKDQDYGKGKIVKNNYPNKWNKNNRVVRVVTKTKIVRQGRHVYRETIQTKYFSNGKVQTTTISRVRIR